jgi:hypothetical protein
MNQHGTGRFHGKFFDPNTTTGFNPTEPLGYCTPSGNRRRDQPPFLQSTWFGSCMFGIPEPVQSDSTSLPPLFHMQPPVAAKSPLVNEWTRRG